MNVKSPLLLPLALALALLLPATPLPAQIAAGTVPRRTSIVVLLCHGLGYGDLSCYGQTNFQTPNLDRLAAQGFRFTDYYAGNGEGASARARLFTGLKSIAPPVTNDMDLPLDPAVPTIAQRLRQSGYHTGYIGEWGLGADPWNRGFEEFAGFRFAGEGRDYYPTHFWRFIPNGLHNHTNFNDVHDFNGPAELHANIGRHETYFPDLQFKMAEKFLHNNLPGPLNQFRPVLLVLDFAVPRAARAHTDVFPVPTDAPYTGEAWPQAARNRTAMINRLDTGIGKLMQALDEPAYSNSVALFVTSDAGPERFADTNLDFLQPTAGLRGRRGDLYEGALRVPLLVRWTGHVPPARTSSRPCAAWDLSPTLLDLAFLPVPPELSGRSLLPELCGVTITNRDTAFTWTLANGSTPEPLRAARLGDWKVVQKGTNAPEIYNLTTDPQERTNLPNADVAAQFNALTW